ncbi:MAG TPA: RMD1 family protein, partial [Polyangia bacterium]|nr:RMD1 family protein [Polyangia bacterium]
FFPPMPLIPIVAYSFASTLKLKELVPLFGAGEARVEKDRLLATLGPVDSGRYVIAYDFGALVFVGVEPVEREKCVAAVGAKLVGEPHPPLTESFALDVQPDKPMEVRFDRVVLPQLELGAVEIVAEVLAQSVAMDYYADDVAEIEAETDRIADELRKVGRIPGRVPNTLQFIGLCIATRNDVISTLALFDKPDATWENEQLDRLWNGLRKMLELDDRYRALDAKLRMFQDNLVLLVDLARQRQTFVLEFAVAVLIAAEMAIMVWQILTTTGHS